VVGGVVNDRQPPLTPPCQGEESVLDDCHWLPLTVDSRLPTAGLPTADFEEVRW
jgi:hypothetical protein